MTEYDYNKITEAPGLKASQEQLARIYHRYRFALNYAESKDVLEVACGCGIGLGFLAGKAKSIVGGDIDKKNVCIACDLYRNLKLQIMEMDAQKIPLENDSFDLILLFEAIYYLEHPQIFVKEANRLLRSHGCLIIATVNKDWADFHPSPYTHKYFSVPELTHLLDLTFKKVELYGAFSTQSASLFSKGSSLLKRTAVRLDLIPGSLAARAHLKRLFMGPLQPVPNQLYDGMASYDPPSPISTDKVNSDFKIIYAVATK